MKRILTATVAFWGTVAAFAEDPLQGPVNSEIIPEIIANRDERYLKVEVLKRTGNQITLMHDQGVTTLNVGAFDDRNLERLFPGYLSRRTAIEAARRNAEEEQQRRFREDWIALDAKIETAVSEALRIADEKSVSAEPFVCVLASARDTYEVGEYPRLTVRLVNRSSKEVLFAGSIEGSASRTAPPWCGYQMVDSSGKTTGVLGEYCNVRRRIQASDFATVGPGQAFDPNRAGFSAYPLYQLTVDRPGIYTVRYHYATYSEQLRDHFGDERMGGIVVSTPDLQKLVDRVPRVSLTSNTVRLTFVAKSK
jgi:hypothetical protein